LLFGSKKKVHKFGKVDIKSDIATLEILLSDYILDYKSDEASERSISSVAKSLLISTFPNL
jgi:hypothetical protein